MTGVKFEITKIRLNSKVVKLKTKWTMPPVKKVKPEFRYDPGHPEGWTDDLGIIADKNQWIEGRDGGWYSELDPEDYHEIRKWCEQNFEHGSWYIGIYYIYIRNENDVAWFLLRWS